MSAPASTAIEERRLAALTDALRAAMLALNAAPCFRCGDTDSYRIAAQVRDALAGVGEVRP